MKRCDVHAATHIEDRQGKVHRIASKWGIDEHRHLAKPSEGGFGCVTEAGERISMWDARAYYQEEQAEPFMNFWVIYDHPRDFPDKFVARRHYIVRGDPEPRASEEYITADSLDEIRQRVPQGLACLARYAEDDPNIVEVWL
jgi:hypothetical protein